MKRQNRITLEKKRQHTIHSLDKASFELLFRQEFKSLCFFAIRYVKDYETSREIVQDAFISLWEKKNTIDLSKPVKSYLSTSVRNKCLNHLRDNKKFNRDILSMEELLADYGTEPQDALVQAEISRKIDIAIGELPEKCREIFVLSRYENLRYQQIADKLKISVKTVETQMSKALQHMRERLKEYIVVLILLLIH